MKRPTTSLPTAPAPGEWNFAVKGRKKFNGVSNPVPDNEWGACLAYEYARESSTLRELVTAFKPVWEGHKAKHDDTGESLREAAATYDLPALPPETTERLNCAMGMEKMTRSFYRSPLDAMQIYPHWWCILWPEHFPHTPWGLIPAAERKSRMRRFRPRAPAWEPLTYLEVVEILTRSSGRAPHSEDFDFGFPSDTDVTTNIDLGAAASTLVKSVELHDEEWFGVGCFRINWSRERKEIIQDFAKWLGGRGRPFKTSLRKPKQKAPEPTALRQLASMRILHALPWETAAGDDRFKDILRKAQGAATAERREVNERLHKMFPLHLLKEEEPLHFPTYTGTKRQL